MTALFYETTRQSCSFLFFGLRKKFMAALKYVTSYYYLALLVSYCPIPILFQTINQNSFLFLPTRSIQLLLSARAIKPQKSPNQLRSDTEMLTHLSRINVLATDGWVNMARWIIIRIPIGLYGSDYHQSCIQELRLIRPFAFVDNLSTKVWM